MFITFEGIEGSGKSTQLQLVLKKIQEYDLPVVVTQEPGGTEIGQYIRSLLLDPKVSFEHPLTELYLFHVDRLEHLERVIKPALKKNMIVLCDRYIDSTFAYQFGGRGLSYDVVMSLIASIDIQPDLTFLLDLRVQEGLKRAKARADLDRFEQEHISFHQRIRKAYMKRLVDDPDRMVLVPVEGASIESVFDHIWLCLEKKLAGRFTL